VDELLKALEENFLLNSMQAMLLWMHIKVIKDDVLQRRLSASYIPVLQQCNNALQKLLQRIKLRRFPHYQQLVERRDKQELKNLHYKKPFWNSIVGEFVTWYYNGDPRRTRNLFEAARALNESDTDEKILRQVGHCLERWI